MLSTDLLFQLQKAPLHQDLHRGHRVAHDLGPGHLDALVRCAFSLGVDEVESSGNLDVPLSSLAILDLLLPFARLAPNIGEHVSLAEHPPSVVSLPTDEEIRLVELAGKRGIDGLLLLPCLGGICDGDTIGLDHCVIGGMPVERSLVPSFPGVEILGVVFHPLHGGMLTCLIVPCADVNEGGLGWEGHCCYCISRGEENGCCSCVLEIKVSRVKRQKWTSEECVSSLRTETTQDHEEPAKMDDGYMYATQHEQHPQCWP